jgi:hypothetical protein
VAKEGEPLWATWYVLDGDPRDRQFPEESPKWKIGCRADREREAKRASVDRARYQQLWVVVPSNEPVKDKRGRDQTGVDDRASAAVCSALADALPSDADSVTGEMLARANGPYDEQKGACLKPDLYLKCEFGGIY